MANVCCFSCPETFHLETVPDFLWVPAPPTWVHVGFSHLEVGFFILCGHLHLLIVLEMPGRHLWFGEGGGAHGFPSPKPMVRRHRVEVGRSVEKPVVPEDSFGWVV